jgi:hypothetical protein
MNGVFKALTYLNGGALVAIPSAVKLFQTHLEKTGPALETAAILFVTGLVAIVVAQACAFFTMARRAESQSSYQQSELLSLNIAYGRIPDASKNPKNDPQPHLDLGSKKITKSNYWRAAGIFFFNVSLLVFIIGCYFGAKAILV